MSRVLRSMLAVALLLFVTRGADAPDIYWVFLHTDAARSALPPAVSAEVLQTRPPLDTDRPIHPAAIEAIAATGARVLYPSRWLRAVGVEADRRTLRRIARLPSVRGIRAARVGFVAGVGDRVVVQQQDSARYGPPYHALREMGITLLHPLGFTGGGLRVGIGVLDTGFYLGHESLRTLTVLGQRDFVGNDANVAPEPGDARDQARHGTHVLSLLAGNAPGRFIGGAPGARVFLAKVKAFGPDSLADELRWVAGVEWLDSMRVQLINSSIGFRDDFADRPQIPYGDLDGNTTITTRMADEAARRGILLVVAIGNKGPAQGSLWAPADADSVISVGSVDSLTTSGAAVPTLISSRGPTADGRTKPELAARAGNVWAASHLFADAYESGLVGSSYAAPLVTAGAALFMEAWPDKTSMGVRDALMLAGSDAARPNNEVGFGVPNVAAAIMFPQGIVLSNTSIVSTDLQGNVTTIAPTFRWQAPEIHPRMTPITYRVEVATDGLFQNLIYSDTTVEAFTHTVRRPLRRTQQAFWRVVATSQTGVRRASATQTFRVPPWVRLLTYTEPVVEFVSESRPEFSWAPLAAPAPVGPFTYEVQLLSATGQILQTIRNLTTSSVRLPQPLTANEAYRWRVIARTTTGAADTVTSPTPFVHVSDSTPAATLLYNPFPNPFPSFELGRSATRIWFDLADSTVVELSVHDLRGRLVRRLIPARPGCGPQTMQPGQYGRSSAILDGDAANGCQLAEWDGTDARGERVPNGIYIIRLRAGRVQDVRRVIYQRN